MESMPERVALTETAFAVWHPDAESNAKALESLRGLDQLLKVRAGEDT